MIASRLRFITLAIMTALIGWLGPSAKADPIQYQYWTVGSVDGNNNGPVALWGIDPPFNPPGAFQVGNFHVPNMTSTGPLTFTNTPFVLDIFFSTGETSAPASEVEVKGVINGTLTSNTESTLEATFTSIDQVGSNPLPFPLPTLSMIGPVHINALSQARPDGTTPVFAYSTFVPVPEPTTLALFGTVFLALGARRWRRARV
ncbi:PEP-CTERM sorting domain-containing protein [Singulisphaera rosea]